jgi:hypothetical protein
MKILLASLVAAGLTLSGGAALAQDSVTGNFSFEGVDTDRDGFVSWPEFELVFEDEITEAQFRVADLDGDSLLSMSEYESLTISTGSIGPAVNESLSTPVETEPSESLTAE